MQQPPMQQPPTQPVPLPAGRGMPEVGSFRQGSEASRYALARYLVGLGGRRVDESRLAGTRSGGARRRRPAGMARLRGFWAVVVAILALGVLARRASLAGGC